MPNAAALLGASALAQSPASQIGKEVAVPAHLADGQEFRVTIQQLIAYGSKPGLPGPPGWVYFEPSPYNPAGNLHLGPANYPLTAPALTVALTTDSLPGPRLHPVNGVVWVPAYTDLKLHDITTGSGDPNAEPLDQNQPAGTPGFFAGCRKFLTRKLWGLYNQGPFMHHGKFTAMHEAIENHNGEALASRQPFDALGASGRDDVIEFLKSLRVLPQGAKSLIVDPEGNPKHWPPR